MGGLAGSPASATLSVTPVASGRLVCRIPVTRLSLFLDGTASVPSSLSAPALDAPVGRKPQVKEN
ncbi:hypothetical protein GCM10009075_28470 [Sphingomonas trueperi]